MSQRRTSQINPGSDRHCCAVFITEGDRSELWGSGWSMWVCSVERGVAMTHWCEGMKSRPGQYNWDSPRERWYEIAMHFQLKCKRLHCELCYYDQVGMNDCFSIEHRKYAISCICWVYKSLRKIKYKQLLQAYLKQIRVDFIMNYLNWQVLSKAWSCWCRSEKFRFLKFCKWLLCVQKLKL